MRPRQCRLLVSLAALPLCLGGCVGVVSEADGDGPATGGPGGPAAGPGGPAADDDPRSLPRGATGLARLSREELSSTLSSLLGVDPAGDLDLLPVDSLAPFDNDYTLQAASRPFVEGLKILVERSVAKALVNPASRAALVGCAPASAADEKCLRDFIVRFGRRALRRPLAAPEVDAYAAFITFARSGNDFFVAVGMVARAMLLDLEFIYRTEIGLPIPDRPGTFRLTGWEIASRLSYLLWGANPDDRLLDAAATGELGAAGGRQAAALRMLADERGARRIQRFHALWLDYERSPFAPALAVPQRKETDALVKAVFESRPWTDLFTSAETFVDDGLRKAYGLPGPGGAAFAWVAYPNADRRGILSHGSVLGNGTKGQDTSPTLRGKFIREKLQCRSVPPPPPDVNADELPATGAAGSKCKYDRYAAHRVGSCATCHSFLDDVGFGLENYDPTGRYRATDDGLPSCAIEGVGKLGGGRTFRGPAQLAKLLLEEGEVSACAIRHLYQFALGRDIREADTAALTKLAARFEASRFNLRALLLDWVADPGFGKRVIEDLGI